MGPLPFQTTCNFLRPGEIVCTMPYLAPTRGSTAYPWVTIYSSYEKKMKKKNSAVSV